MSSTNHRVGVLFVCMGNICRSPTAEGVFTHLATERGLAERLRIDSAGTVEFHVGEPPDPRAQAAALQRGIDLSPLRARHVQPSDFETFHYVLAMDEENLGFLRRRCPDGHTDKVRLFLEFAPKADVCEVPDPYYGGLKGFERVFSLVREASLGLLTHIEEHHFS